MRSVASLRPVKQRRTVGVAVGATFFLIVLVSGLAFANSVGAAEVAENARALHWTNATLGTASATRLALVQASTFVQLEGSGEATPQDVEFAMTQATAAADELHQLQESGLGSESLPYLTRVLGPVDDSIDALRRGDSAAAHGLLMGDLETAYMSLVDALQTEQTSIQSRIDVNTEGAARMTAWIRFVLTFAIPAAAVVVYRFIARRAVREHQMRADLEIQAERAVGRAKDEFIAGLSHELRTPLTSIYGFAEILTDAKSDDPENTREMAQIIANEASEMTRMVDDLLAAARIESTGIAVEAKPTRIRDVVDAARLPFERAGLDVKLTGDDVWVTTDGARLRHILVNLLSNAARHGGPQIGIEISAGDGLVDIEVWDTGAGVPDDQLQKMFDRYIHNGASPLLTGSLGLGLAIASRLATLLGGKLSYQRFLQKSYFVVSLPASDLSRDVDAGPKVADVIRAMTA